MPKTTCQKSNERNVNMICQVYNQNTEKVMKYIKKTKEKSEYATVPKQFKTNESQNGMFLKPYSYYEYRGDNLQHSVVNNNENQSRNPRAVALSTNARLRFNSSMSSLLGAFDFPSEKFVPFPKFFSLLQSAILGQINLSTFQCLNFQFCSNCAITIHNEQQDIPPCHPRCDND